MRSPTLRAARALLLLAVAALAACNDNDPLPTQPPIDVPFPSSPGNPGAPGTPGGDTILPPYYAQGDVWTVTSTADDGVGSLRWTLRYVTGGETVVFDPALAGQTIVLDSAITTYKPFTLDGPPGKGITLSGGGKVRVFFLYHPGVVTIRNVSIVNGLAPQDQDGAGIKSIGDLVLENVSLTGHVADGRSAIIATDALLRNVTITGNSSPKGFEAAYLINSRVVNSTIAYNTGGGIAGNSGIVLKNSIIAHNGAGRNCDMRYFTEVYEGRNLSDDTSCGSPSVMMIGETALAPVADNGGPSLTMALLPGSLAIDAGTSCSEATDGRTFPRDAACDLGAFEFADFTTIALTPATTVMVSTSSGWAVVTGTMKCSRAESFSVTVDLAQDQKAGKTPTTVTATGSVPVACDTTVRPFSVALSPATGAFQTGGTATVTVRSTGAPKWATPASVTQAVKLAPARR